MVEGEQMGVAELHNTLGVGAHGSNIATELVPGEDDADLHHTIQRASRPWAWAPAGSTTPAVLAVRRADIDTFYELVARVDHKVDALDNTLDRRFDEIAGQLSEVLRQLGGR